MWEEGSCTNLITLNDEKNIKELHKHIISNLRITLEIKEHLIATVKKYWIFFANKVRTHNPGTQVLHRHIKCKNSMLQEDEIQTILIQDYNGSSKCLNHKYMYKKYKGPWCRRIVLSTKPHQEHIKNIDDLI